MKKFVLHFICIALSLSAIGQTKVTTSGIFLREAPSGEKLTIVPKGTVLEIGGCSNGWCATSYADQEGYVSEVYLKDPGAQTIELSSKPQSPVHYYTNSQGYTVQSPTRYDTAPSGASAQCYDGTYSFSRSRRGTCSHHGGVKRWL